MVRYSYKQLVYLTFWVITIGFILIFTTDVREIHRRLVKKVHLYQPRCRDWNDYYKIAWEDQRIGPGEQGSAVELTDPEEIERNEKLLKEIGFAAVVSDKISFNRSIVDARSGKCKNLKYLAKLPNVSVIIIFVNEVKSILIRTIHSVINRTPPELLHEIILVNDNSTDEELYGPLQEYVDLNFNGKVRIKNLNERKGLIVTRLEGARIATGEVLVFFDSHIEVGTNWLPPLLEPIALNRRLATVPVIDDFDPRTFEFFAEKSYGGRAVFDWMLIYRHFDRYLPPGADPIKPFPTPIMLGCAFAIDRKFFWELGGYDEGFQIWNAENYELSFKLWLCADGLYEVPCSRVTHSFRMASPSHVRSDDYVGRNFKRLVEVWFDEYKDVVYSWEPWRYKKIDAGDLTTPKEVRARLNCKPFSYFVNDVAPEFLERFPPTKDQPVFASGQIRSMADDKVCLDTFYRNEFEPIGLYYCQKLDAVGKPTQSQFFRLNFLKMIVLGHMENCLDSYNMAMPQCTYVKFGNQYWKFDRVNRMLINGGDDGASCLVANLHNQTVSLMDCDEENIDQRWTFTYENMTALDDWENIYGYQKFVYGDKKMNREKMLPLDYETC